ncbi:MULTISPECIES: ABC transporter permease [Pseudomonas syringae group]|uniref:ABC transporter permease n=1 Tax=Pseudomonas syringae group TaxID=136849 RepID=UPI000BB6525E|nr:MULTISPECIES: ABC transporter permease subunit [Pseudomonas syringae group]PBQ09323.1 ABC transporter permease [Pseudomonas syringae]
MTVPDFSVPFDDAIDSGLGWLTDHGEKLFDAINAGLAGVYQGVLWCISTPPFYVIALVIALIGWRAIGLRFAVLSGVALLFCSLIGLWTETASTLALVLTATFLGLVVAIPLGVLAGLAPSIDRVVDPALDLVQTMPPYIYLLPAIALLGYGPATALLATFIVAVPPALRLTSLGIRMTPKEFIELGEASGVTGWQMFYKIRLPFALPSIMAGVNQSLMMAFGMVVIAGIVGSGGLGESIYGAVRTLDIAKSIDAAIAIVILTMILDRLAQSAARSTKGEAA